MDKKLYRELWTIRFRRMLELEKKAARDYQAMLEDCRSRNKNHAVMPHLERLIGDEKEHAVLVEELIQILNRQTD